MKIRLVLLSADLLARLCEDPTAALRGIATVEPANIELLKMVAVMSRDCYQRIGAQPPWTAYLAVNLETSEVVGTCGFKEPEPARRSGDCLRHFQSLRKLRGCHGHGPAANRACASRTGSSNCDRAHPARAQEHVFEAQLSANGLLVGSLFWATGRLDQVHARERSPASGLMAAEVVTESPAQPTPTNAPPAIVSPTAPQVFGSITEVMEAAAAESAQSIFGK